MNCIFHIFTVCVCVVSVCVCVCGCFGLCVEVEP